MRLQGSVCSALLAGLLSLGVLLALPAIGHAWEGWCEDDPGVLVNGQEIILAVSVPQETLAEINGVAQFVVTVPAGVDARVIENDATWFPDTITIQTGGRNWNGKGAIPVDVSVIVPGSESLPVQFLIKKPNLALTNVVSGAANQPLTRHVELPASLIGTGSHGKGS